MYPSAGYFTVPRIKAGSTSFSFKVYDLLFFVGFDTKFKI